MLTSGTKKNYEYVYLLLKRFSEECGFELRLRPISNNKRIYNQEKRYYKDFYQRFTKYLYEEKGAYDNYVGHNVKCVKAFFKWLNLEKGAYTGEFYKTFHVWKEEIPVLALDPTQLNFLINDKEFTNGLNKKMQRVKDLFVFGCTVGLRVSDLLRLRKENVERINGSRYLKVFSKKSTTYTKIKLPPYAVEILDRQPKRGVSLFKAGSYGNFNVQVKKLMELAGWTQEYPKIRTRRGVPVVQYKDKKKKVHYRFCDLASTHMMRRTAITTMLSLGVEEQTVRKISGHAPGSVEFYKYVKYNQMKVDEQTDLMFEKLMKTDNNLPKFA